MFYLTTHSTHFIYSYVFVFCVCFVQLFGGGIVCLNCLFLLGFFGGGGL